VKSNLLRISIHNPAGPPATCRPMARARVKALLGRLIALGLILTVAPPLAAAAERFSNADCLDCHLDPTTTRKRGNQVIPLIFPTNAFARSVHASLDCVDCHEGIPELVHPSPLPPPNCAGCHEAEAKEYAASIHGVSHALGASGAAQCWDCHGSHDILPVSHAESPVFKLNLPRTCARCHSNPGLTEEYRMKHPEAAAHYLDSIHGQALLKRGLIVAPSCNDCHGIHNIKRSVDRDSPVHHLNVARTCGKCHLGIEQTFERSIHGQRLLQGDKRAPDCTTCHSAHEIEPPASGHFKATSDRKCGQCHQDRLTRYHETYHGKAILLGRPNRAPDVAACYDCHGHHDVLPSSDPNSRLSPNHILATCQQCHPKATIGFTQYKPHADPMDRENYPVLHAVFVGMTSLVVAVFVFFGAHTLAWLTRTLYLYLHDSKTFREAKIQVQQDDEWFTRFTPFERFLHLLVVTSFLLLVLTGMPLKFYYTDWAKTLFNLIGGPDTARVLHRFGAVVTFLYFGLHLAALAAKAWRGRHRVRDPQTGRWDWQRLRAVLFGPDSMIPTLQDWRDFVAHNRWFFGKGPKPQFDRWTYWEKFDYLAVFWGVFMIGTSGLIMWWPDFFTRFLPGWVINVAIIIHSDEALLAAGFIFTIHFFNTHFRLEKFPMDTVIFSGRISRSELLHERRRWYDRLIASGQLDQFRVRDDWEGWKGIARGLGYLFFGTGVVLLVLILYAMGTRLIH